MTGKRSKRLNSALVSVGMVALVAGCGGGGAVSNSGGGVTYIPPAGGKMTTATLSLLVPGRRPSAGSRSPQYVSPYTQRVDVSAVAAGAPSPWPVATSTSIPTPGPVPSGATPSPIPVTMQVQVPAGNAQFAVNTYDSGGYLLSGLSSGSIAVSLNAANNINLVLNAAADCVQINGVAGGSMVFSPLVNQTGPQSSTFTVTPCDADGYAIPAGQNLANAITFATPSPTQVIINANKRHRLAAGPTPTPGPTTVTFSPSVITQGGPTTVTVTYPSGTNAVFAEQAVPSPLPPSLYGGYASVTVDPIYTVLIMNRDDSTVSAYAKDMQGTLPFTYLGYLNTASSSSTVVGDGPMHGCAQGGQAVAIGQGGTTVFTEPTPSAANPMPTPNTSTLPGFSFTPTSAGMDLSCNVYIGDLGGYVSTLTGQMSGFGTQYGGSYGANPPAGVLSTAWVAGTAYAGLDDVGGYMNTVVNLAGADQNVAPHAVAMARYNAGALVIAYQPVSYGDYYLAEWTPGGGLTNAADLSNSNGDPLTNLAVDPNGMVWAATSCGGNLYKYDPSNGTVSTYSLGSYCNAFPTGIAAGADGTLYIIDNADGGFGTVNLYSWQNITGGGVGNTAALIETHPAGNNPLGITLLP